MYVCMSAVGVCLLGGLGGFGFSGCALAALSQIRVLHFADSKFASPKQGTQYSSKGDNLLKKRTVDILNRRPFTRNHHLKRTRWNPKQDFRTSRNYISCYHSDFRS